MENITEHVVTTSRKLPKAAKVMISPETASAVTTRTGSDITEHAATISQETVALQQTRLAKDCGPKLGGTFRETGILSMNFAEHGAMMCRGLALLTV